MFKLRNIIYILVCLSVMTACGGRSGSYRQCSGSVWATTYNIVYDSPTDLSDSILAVMKSVERSLSPFDSTSLISRINRGESPVVDSLLVRVFLKSQNVNEVSGGAFDPTVAPWVNLWGFGYKNHETEPSDADIDSALLRVGIAKCRIAAGHIIKHHPATEFNFSAITKGYGCDLVGEMFRRNGVDNYMVEIGGEIALCGVNPEGEKWHIQIDAPVADSRGAAHHALSVVSLTDCGIATSGNYRNYRDTETGRRWHTIDPSTGRPAKSDILSATVVASTCMEADALATACMAMNSAAAMKMVESYDGAEVMLVLAPDSEKGGFRVLKSNNMVATDSQ